MSEVAGFQSINPATEETLGKFPEASEREVAQALERATSAFRSWSRTPVEGRCERLRAAAATLRAERDRFAMLATAEMGKPIAEAEAEIEKCAWAFEYFADHAPSLLALQPRPSSASYSAVEFVPLGTVLAIMPWNFPFWQVMRFAAPTVAAGNTAVLKHASNVPQCADACARLFAASGFPEGVFTNLRLRAAGAERLIEHPAVAAVTLTGSERAGAAIAAAAGRAIKKTVLELGGSDPFVVLADAELDKAAEAATRSRFQNAGQSCIAAKRFIVAREVYGEFRERFVARASALRVGDPTQRDTDLGPLARGDLREEVERQLERSVAKGARVLCGGSRKPGRGFFFEPTVVEGIQRDMPLWNEEVFGPVAALVEATDVEHALTLANDSRYGLGATLWTSDLDRARQLAPRVEAGQVFVNGIVASDSRLPFGGVKRSGYGRELADFGIREFVNVQTLWVGPKKDA